MRNLFFLFCLIINYNTFSQIPSVNIKTVDGGIINTSEFNNDGHPIVISFWATWCKPCKVEYPFLRKLEQYFSKSNEIKIISVSTDEKFEKWKKYIDENSIEGTQLYSGANSDFVKFYDIGALPRFIFLDKEGKVINPEEIRPSNPGLLEKLEANLH